MVTNLDELRDLIGIDVYNKIEKEADNEVGLAMTMPLLDQWHKEKYYSWRFIMPDFLDEFLSFEEKGLKLSPLDIFSILFRCKIFSASLTENEYHQRVGGAYFHSGSGFTIPWSLKSKSVDELVNIYFDRLLKLQKERTLLTVIESFQTTDINLSNLPNLTPQEFFINLFEKLDISLYPYFEGDHLITELKKHQPEIQNAHYDSAKYVFQPPSFGYKCFGTEKYCYHYSVAWLRTFLNLLRIAGFIYPGQMDFGQSKVRIKAPTSSVFLGTNSFGTYSWEEDEKEPWAKIPDGCLFLSFGYRGLSAMWIDSRTYGGIEKFFLDHKKIFENLKNPWTRQNLYDVMPTLDILSASTQIPDLGAKVLQIYCCLEHLFVPKNIDKDNKKYIVGGINALKPDLLAWFNELYKLRCTYAHRGFVIRDDKTRNLITQSIQNIMTLLVAKLSNI